MSIFSKNLGNLLYLYHFADNVEDKSSLAKEIQAMTNSLDKNFPENIKISIQEAKDYAENMIEDRLASLAISPTLYP